MGIRELMIAALERSGLSKKALARNSTWSDGNITAFEKGRKGASPESIDSWIDGCGFELVLVPKGALDSREVESLPVEQRELILRLVRLLLGPPPLLKAHVDTILGHVERWESQREAAPVAAEGEQVATAAATARRIRLSSS